jgi:hypothetical protein
MAVTKGGFSITRPSQSASRGRQRYFLARGMSDWLLATSPHAGQCGMVIWQRTPRSLKERRFHLISFLCISDHCFRKTALLLSTHFARW